MCTRVRGQGLEEKGIQICHASTILPGGEAQYGVASFPLVRDILTLTNVPELRSTLGKDVTKFSHPDVCLS